MTDPLWQLDNNQATFSTSSLSGIVDLRRPDSGWHNLRIAGTETTDIRSLCIGLPAPEDLKDKLSEVYVRSRDLVATYDESPQRPFRTQIYWRTIPANRHDRLLGGCDLIVSVNTSGLDVTSEGTTHTTLPDCQALHLVDDNRSQFEELSSASNGQFNFRNNEGPGVFLFRPAGVDWSYAELVHPVDFSESQLTRSGANQPQRLTHRLFHRWVEKGVIVRTRMRMVFMSRSEDEATAVGCFHELRHAKLPLTV